jgi:hypothetical protein
VADLQKWHTWGNLIETLHARCRGIIEVAMFLILENVSASQWVALDALAFHFYNS